MNCAHRKGYVGEDTRYTEMWQHIKRVPIDRPRENYRARNKHQIRASHMSYVKINLKQFLSYPKSILIPNKGSLRNDHWTSRFVPRFLPQFTISLWNSRV